VPKAYDSFLKILFLEIVESFQMRVMDTHYTCQDVTGQKVIVRNDSDNIFYKNDMLRCGIAINHIN
jgi:hypothetical protein